jgi:hypothetical protein
MPSQIADISLPVRDAPNREYPAPLKPSGALDKFAFEETTPAIGREFQNVNIVDDILNAANADELIRDLAITSIRFTYLPSHRETNPISQSPNGASSSSGPKTTSPTTCKSSWCTD